MTLKHSWLLDLDDSFLKFLCTQIRVSLSTPLPNLNQTRFFHSRRYVLSPKRQNEEENKHTQLNISSFILSSILFHLYNCRYHYWFSLCRYAGPRTLLVECSKYNIHLNKVKPHKKMFYLGSQFHFERCLSVHKGNLGERCCCTQCIHVAVYYVAVYICCSNFIATVIVIYFCILLSLQKNKLRFSM